MAMSIPKVLAIIGVLVLLIGVLTIPITREVWETKSKLLESETVELSPFGYERILTAPYFEPENVRNVRIIGYVRKVSGEDFTFEITDGRVYLRAENVSEREFNFPIDPEEFEESLWLRIEPAKSKVSVYVRAVWEERSYFYSIGGLFLGAFLILLGVILIIASIIAHVARGR